MLKNSILAALLGAATLVSGQAVNTPAPTSTCEAGYCATNSTVPNEGFLCKYIPYFFLCRS